MRCAEAGGCVEGAKPAHGIVALLNAPMILFNPVVHGATGVVMHLGAERLTHRTRVGVVATAGRLLPAPVRLSSARARRTSWRRPCPVSRDREPSDAAADPARHPRSLYRTRRSAPVTAAATSSMSRARSSHDQRSWTAGRRGVTTATLTAMGRWRAGVDGRWIMGRSPFVCTLMIACAFYQRRASIHPCPSSYQGVLLEGERSRLPATRPD